jgi:hypothetical protein
LGGSNEEEAFEIQEVQDGYTGICFTQSTDGDVAWNQGFIDAWAFKVSLYDELMWQKPLGGSNIDDGFSIDKT